MWDTAGQECISFYSIINRRFRSLIPSYIRDSTVAILVYDLTNQCSFYDIDKWYSDVKEQKDDIITIVVGNKADMEKSRYDSFSILNRMISTAEGEKKAADLHSLFIETSAKTGENVDSIFRKVINEIPQMQPKPVDGMEKCTKYSLSFIKTFGLQQTMFQTKPIWSVCVDMFVKET